MIIRKAELDEVCGYTSSLPDHDLPEIAFAGKSNVGKSSLINTLMNRKSLARISSQPGKTQTINFYKINDAFYLTDLPGYGFARVSEEEKLRWGEMIENYLHTSRQLRAVFLLIDFRHAPSENDAQMYDWMVYQGFSPIIIATKADKVKPSEWKKHLFEIQSTLQTEEGTQIIPFSAVTRAGKEEIHDLIAEFCDYQEIETPKPQKKQAADPKKKQRWKNTGKPTAKKTLKKRKKNQSKRKKG